MENETTNMSVRSFAMYPETYEKLTTLKKEMGITWDEAFQYLLKNKRERDWHETKAGKKSTEAHR